VIRLFVCRSSNRAKFKRLRLRHVLSDLVEIGDTIKLQRNSYCFRTT